MTPSDAERAMAMLAAAGLEPSAAETGDLLERYTRLRSAIESLYRLSELRHEDLGLVFEASPSLTEWDEPRDP